MRLVQAEGMMNTCHILYATQSGRAKAIARRCSRLVCDEKNIRVLNKSGETFDDFINGDLTQFCHRLRGSFLILIVSTTGDGEQTDSIRHTWKLL